MRAIARASIAGAFCALCGCATSGRIDGLAKAERAFAASAQTDGVKAAFLGALADDATLFRPGPVNGKASVAAAPRGAYRLEWEPRRVSVATSDELGYSSGPYRLTPDAKPGEPTYGQFMTIWRRGRDGRWQVLVDQGIGHATPIEFGGPVDGIANDGSRATGPVAAAEADFAARSARDGLGAAYRASASTRMRLLREEVDPIDGLDRLPTPDTRWTWFVTDSGTSRSEDLAWTMGRYRSEASNTPRESGYFVRVWRAESGDWKILADVLAPVEPGR